MRRKPLFPPPKNESSGKNFRNKGRQEYSVLTVNGRVVLRRIRWHDPSIDSMGSITPIDGFLDKAEQSISVATREIACRLNGSSTNFEKTAENLSRAAQIVTSGETLRVLIESEGREVIKAQQEGRLPLDWSAKDCQTEEGPTRLYLGSDGVMVPLVTDVEKKKRREKIKAKRRSRGEKSKPLPRAKAGADQKYKEFKIVTLYDETQEHRLVAGTKGDCTQAGRLMREQAARVQLDKAEEKVGNVDGSPWIRNQIESQNLYLDALGLDFYHLSEQVHKARRTVYGETNEEGTKWVTDLLHTYKHEGYEPAWEKLVKWRTGLRGRVKRKAADSLMGYVSERREMILYPEFIAKGWQIGSGPTEATCKTLTARLKGPRKWDPSNAEAIMALEALSQSGLWKAYWQSLLPERT